MYEFNKLVFIELGGVLCMNSGAHSSLSLEESFVSTQRLTVYRTWRSPMYEINSSQFIELGGVL